MYKNGSFTPGFIALISSEKIIKEFVKEPSCLSTECAPLLNMDIGVRPSYHRKKLFQLIQALHPIN